MCVARLLSTCKLSVAAHIEAPTLYGVLKNYTFLALITV